MSQTSSEKFLYFTIGLLKGSPTLDALREDATKHHMIDHPGQLIALRLTEYYEMMSQQDIAKLITPAPASPETEATAGNEKIPTAETHVSQRSGPIPVPSSVAPHTSMGNKEPTNVFNQLTGKMRAVHRDGENIVTVSSAAEQNADDAADYWSPL